VRDVGEAENPAMGMVPVLGILVTDGYGDEPHERAVDVLMKRESWWVLHQ